jgi:hydroxymethylbilane synthase
VHSLKDVPSDDTPGLAIAAYPLREDPRDALVSFAHDSFEALPRGARLGTASLRRQAQALHRRPDLDIVMFRGNVETRLRKLEAAEVDACLLAVAGLNRLGLADRVRQAFDPLACPPAPGQGCIAIQTRADDVGQAWARALHHPPTALLIAAERGALESLEGSCRTAMGAFARVEGGVLHLIVEALVPDGSARWRREASLPLDGASGPDACAQARDLGLRLGLEVKAEGGDRLVWDHD